VRNVNRETGAEGFYLKRMRESLWTFLIDWQSVLTVQARNRLQRNHLDLNKQRYWRAAVGYRLGPLHVPGSGLFQQFLAWRIGRAAPDTMGAYLNT
jgi:hypothetical protein